MKDELNSLDAEFRAYVGTLQFQGASAFAERGLGLLFRKDKDPVRAEAAFREALAKAPDDPEVLSLCVKGFSLLENQEKEAEELLRRAVDQDPLNSALRYELSGWFPDGDIEVPHLRLCADMDPADPVGMASRAWLAFLDVDREHYLAAPSMGDEGPAKALEALTAAPNAPAGECLRVALLLLSAGDVEGALLASKRAAAGTPADPAAFEALARAAAAGGDGAEFVRALLGCRGALEARAKAAGGAAAAGLEDQVSRVLVEAIAYALALEKPAEARRACEAWFSRPNGSPRLEAEWMFYAGLPLLTGDTRAFMSRFPQAAAAAPGSMRIDFLPRFAKRPPTPGGKKKEE